MPDFHADDRQAGAKVVELPLSSRGHDMAVGIGLMGATSRVAARHQLHAATLGLSARRWWVLRQLFTARSLIGRCDASSTTFGTRMVEHTVMAQSSRKTFDRELLDLDVQILCTAALLIEAVAVTGEALAGGDHDLATTILAGHAEIDRGTHLCEVKAYEVLARRQPAAGDMRFVVTVVRLAHELERSAKLVRHVARFAAQPHGSLPPRLSGLLARMAEEACRLFQGAIDAYAERDVERAEALDVWDDRMDELHRRLLAELFTARQSLATTLELALVGRYLERIADHAVTIGDRVRYLVRAEL